MFLESKQNPAATFTEIVLDSGQMQIRCWADQLYNGQRIFNQRNRGCTDAFGGD